ncbi:NAD(P)H-binding protein [Streptomyces boluensis]|uniref:NAD(P)H-binding protein n=1 Tax=Streptomyces boluensis TaxID=1775135 RepID=A0A964UTB7_9ACTN|nr:NAD(P)H-binding protein [Streptomyces boluensis]NBE55053.1 NAD(P)H-binding protein [Streptomyces boluensis]
MILVTGATGNVGRNLVRELLDAGEKVRAVTRNPAASGLPDDVEAVPGDLTRPETLPAALRGVDRAFLFPVHGALDAFLAAAENEGTRHIVLLSSDSVTFARPGWIGEQHLACEQAVADSAIPWTFVRPTVFMANDLAWAHGIRHGGTVRGVYGSGAMAPVDERDIAAIAAHALLTPHPGTTYELTGPHTLSQIDRVRIIGETLGVLARFEETSRDDVRGRLLDRLPPPAADFLLDQLAASRTEPVPTLPTVEQVTQRPARTYAEWVAHHAAAFVG